MRWYLMIVGKRFLCEKKTKMCRLVNMIIYFVCSLSQKKIDWKKYLYEPPGRNKYFWIIAFSRPAEGIKSSRQILGSHVKLFLLSNK